MFAAPLRYTGAFSCSTGSFVVKVTADNCEPQALVDVDGHTGRIIRRTGK